MYFELWWEGWKNTCPLIFPFTDVKIMKYKYLLWNLGMKQEKVPPTNM